MGTFLGFFCIINFTIRIFLFLFFPTSLSLLFFATIHCSPPTTLSASFHPLSPMSLPPPLILLQPVTTYPSFLHTHHLLTSLLYQLHTSPDPCNP
jgi:hypothetical protein